jgi:cell division protein ZapA (FtsZ GTPase activity inhibitor)
MNLLKSVEVEIYGRKFKLRGDDPDKITRIAKALNQQLEELNDKYDIIDQYKLLILNSLIISEQLIDLQDLNVSLKEEIDRLNKLISTFISDNDI